jgi:hypothetical protein
VEKALASGGALEVPAIQNHTQLPNSILRGSAIRRIRAENGRRAGKFSSSIWIHALIVSVRGGDGGSDTVVILIIAKDIADLGQREKKMRLRF